MSNDLSHKGNEMKITPSFLLPVRMAIIKKTTTNAGKDVGAKETLYSVGSHCRNQSEVSLKN
jgi:hypothetical protein